MQISYIGDKDFSSWVESTVTELRARLPFSLSTAPHTPDTPPVDLLLIEAGLPVPASPTSLIAHVLPAEAKEKNPHSTEGYVLQRGAQEANQLRVVLELAHSRSQANSFGQLIASPFAHDVRGVIGVVNLAAQVLSANEQNAAISKKLVAVGIKMSELLETLQAAAPVPHEFDEHSSAGESWSTMTDALQSWFQAAHRSRTLELEQNNGGGLSLCAEAIQVIVRGMVDACTRYSPKMVPVKLRATLSDESPEFEVCVNQTSCSDKQRAILSAPPSEWNPSQSDGVPWRLWVAHQLAAGLNFDLSTNLSGESLTLRLSRLPPRQRSS